MFDVQVQKTFTVVRNGAELQIDCTRFPAEIINAIFGHGVTAKIGDAAAGAATQVGESHFGKPRREVPKADWDAWADSRRGREAIAKQAEAAMEAVYEALANGDWTVRGGGAGAARQPADPILAHALKTAKTDLLAVFKKRTGARKIADMLNADDGAVAKYFTADGVWLDAEVVAFIDRQAEAGKRDYRTEAEAALSGDDLDI